MGTWDKYMEYVEHNLRYMPCGSYCIGSVPVSWDDQGQVDKFVAVNMSVQKGRNTKEALKYLLAEKLPPVWSGIPQHKKPQPKGETE